MPSVTTSERRGDDLLCGVLRDLSVQIDEPLAQFRPGDFDLILAKSNAPHPQARHEWIKHLPLVLQVGTSQDSRPAAR